MQLPLIFRIGPSRLKSGDTPVPSPSLRQVWCRSLSRAFLALSLLFPAAQAAPFTPGNLVIYRVGNGATTLANAGAAVFLDEYSPTGSLVQSIPLPTTDSASNFQLVASGTAVSEGLITRSTDARYLAVTGYDAEVNAGSLSSSVAESVFRTIGRVDWNGAVDTSKRLQDFADLSNPRSAFTLDNTAFWVSGGGAVGSNGGLRHSMAGSSVLSTQLNNTSTNLRQVHAFGGQLYVSSASGTTRLAAAGTGLPVTNGQTITNLPGISTSNSTSPYSFFFADLSTSVAGNDTLYIADDVLGLQKFSLVGGTWSANGSIGTAADNFRGLTATVKGTSVTLFVTNKGGNTAAGGGQLIELIDTSGYNATITGTPTLLATAATNTAFRGVALAPYSRPDLTVDLTAPATAFAGNSFTYTLTPRNIGNVAATGIGLGFVVPTGLTVGTINGASGFSGFASGNIVNFTGGSLAAGASATLTINANSATAGTFAPATQAAFIDPSDIIIEADETNNGSSQVISTVVTGTGIAPTVTTGSASGITETTATLTGSVNPNGFAAVAQFEYGLNNGYGSTATVTLSPNNGTAAQPVSATLSGLQAGQTYHYRLTATNSGGPAAGANTTFSTYPTVPYAYTVSAGNITITGYTGSGGAVTIPTTIVGLPVTAIGESAFSGKTTITSLVVPVGVTHIGSGAFSSCTNLTNVILPNGLLHIGASAFQSCISLTGIVVPNSVTDIGPSAFKSCNVLASATLPIGLTLIADSLFHSCTALSQINIPATVTSIGNESFRSCWSLATITFPSGLTTIGSDAFIGCSSMTTVTIPALVTAIGSNAFAICHLLTSAYFQGSAPTMGTSVFEGASNAGFTVYFIVGNSGFTSPTWQGYPSVGLSAPAITTHPASQSVATGATATLWVAATGSPAPNFQWYRGNSGDISTPVGTNSASFTTPALTTTTSYWVQATNTSGIPANSQTATVTVTPVVPDWQVAVTGPVSVARGDQFDYVVTVTNVGSAPLPPTDLLIADDADILGPAAPEFEWLSYQFDGWDNIVFPVPEQGIANGIFETVALQPGESDILRLRMRVPVSASGTARLTALVNFTNALDDSNPANDTSSIQTAVTYAPAITTQPQSQTISSGTTVQLSVVATGFPAPVFQWYLGLSGDTSNPVSGSNSATFTTPALTAPTSYWVQATNTSGIPANSNTAVIMIASSNADLGDLATSDGNLAPAFDPATIFYTAKVSNQTTDIHVSATKAQADAGLQVRINGGAFADMLSAVFSPALALDEGSNTIEVKVTAQDDSTKTYTVTVTRAPPLLVSSLAAGDVAASSAVANGTITPNGDATVYFEYGTTTSYGNLTPFQAVTGGVPLNVQAALTNLTPGTPYHYRLVAFNGTDTVFGNDRTFTTVEGSPVVVAGNPFGVTTAAANLVGAVDGRGLEVTVYFEYGTTTLYGQRTADQVIPTGAGFRDIVAPISGMVANSDYFWRIIASSAGGTTLGPQRTFKATTTGDSGNGTPSAAPEVETGIALSIDTNSANLRGIVDSKGGSAGVWVEFGTSASFGRTSAPLGIGNVNGDVVVSLPVSNLEPGTEYHYRVVARNSLGTSQGGTATFRTKYLPPSATTGAATALSTNSVRVAGSLSANGDPSTAVFRYGTSPSLLDQIAEASPATVTGTAVTRVQADLADLLQGMTYYYRLEGTNSGGKGEGAVQSFDIGILSGLDRRFPDLIAAGAHSGALKVDLLPAEIGAGWRFIGEPAWRAPGSSAAGLAGGDRLVEFRPAAGHVQPANETIPVSSGGGPLVISRTYTPSGAPADGHLQVFLKPDSAISGELPADQRIQWRFSGEPDSAWRDSGVVATDLVPGAHVIEAKAVDGFDTPAPFTAAVANGETATATITWFVSAEAGGVASSVLGFPAVSQDQDRPFAFAGQFLTDAGAGSGFVIKPGVVATAGHVMFDDGTLAATTGVRWLFQRAAGEHEPVPVEPRGFYLLAGYAAQRAQEDSPGESSEESQNLDAAAVYFTTDISRHGYSGYLASDSNVNEFVVSGLEKSLVGYLVDRIPVGNIGRMHATPPAPATFSPGFGQTYATPQIRGGGGMSGGPLCVRDSAGIWYPAAIFLGGTRQTVVRAINGDVARLFGFAEASAESLSGETGGAWTLGGTTPTNTPGLGGLRVIIEPAAARAAGAGWRINAGDPYQPSGGEIADLLPNTYTVRLPVLPGFLPPPTQAAAVTDGQLRTLSFTYQEIILPPVVTSPSEVVVTRGQPLDYQLQADSSPVTFNLSGNLPAGVTFDAAQGRISGIPQEAGVFTVQAGATHSGGSGIKSIAISSLPVLAPQSAAGAKDAPFSYQVVSSEDGPGVSWSAGGLPDGLFINANTGLVSGTPNFAGNFSSLIAVTFNGATATTSLAFEISGNAPVFTLQPPASRVTEFGTGTTFLVEATGDPAPSFQWYRGSTGDISHPVGGATSATFFTPPLTVPTSYWVHAFSSSGEADSTAVSVTLSPSANPALVNLIPVGGQLTPFFNPSVTSYSLTLPHAADSFTLTPFTLISQTTVTVQGQAVASENPSAAISLDVGTNPVAVVATAGDGIAQRTYTVAVTRLPAPLAITDPATSIGHSSADLNGLVTPNGPARVFFEYGTGSDPVRKTPARDVTGSEVVEISTTLSGLDPEESYQYRLIVETATGSHFGETLDFITAPEPPLVATGNAVQVTTAQAVLRGAVNPKGLPAVMKFEYGQTNALGNFTSEFHPTPDAGTGVVEVSFTLTGLIPNADYYYRLIGATAAGTSEGDIVGFNASTSPGTGDGVADSPPTVQTNPATQPTISSATLNGLVFPNDGSTQVWFEYGLTAAYGQRTAAVLVGNGNQQRPVTEIITGLDPEMEYHFRIVAENSEGPSVGIDRTFRTNFNPPLALTGIVEALSPTSVRLTGNVDPNGASTGVDFIFGTDGIAFPQGVAAQEDPLVGNGLQPVSGIVSGLSPSVTYHFRIRATNSGGEALSGNIVSFQTGALMGLIQELPPAPPPGNRNGQLVVNILPAGIGAWRFSGETRWRAPGIPASGLTTSDRMIEFLPVAGFIPPPPKSVGIISNQPPVTVLASYHDAGEAGSTGLTVQIEPATVSDPGLPEFQRAQWRLAGVPGEPWRDSGETAIDLAAGNHLVEFKTLSGHLTPSPRAVVLDVEEFGSLTATYFPSGPPLFNPPVPVSFSTATTSPLLPHAYNGQVRGNAGHYSGFAVKRRVVATAAQAVFDESTLALAGNLEWLWLPDPSNHQPKPIPARGVYIFDGYAARRAVESSPGTLSAESQNLNVAALYFSEEAARGGSSGFLSSNSDPSPHLTSSGLKILSGYPVAGVSSDNLGRLHATTPSSASLAKILGGTYESAAIRGLGGMVGGPLSVRLDGGAYYPAAINVGGANGAVVRSIDSNIIDLFSRAEVSSNGGDNDTGGGITHTSFAGIGSSTSPGAVRVTILPAAARDAGAGWRLKGQNADFRGSTSQIGDLAPGTYLLQLTAVSGYPTPSDRNIDVKKGNLTEIIFDYRDLNTPPTLSTIAGRTINEDATTGAIAFNVNDPDVAANTLTVTRTSSNTSLVPTANIVLAGSGSNRTVTVTPAANLSGSATITLTVGDGALTSAKSFVLMVNPVNDPPTITMIANRDVAFGTNPQAIPFTIGDLETAASSLTLTRSSSNETFAPLSNIVLTGSGASRTITITPAPGQLGTSSINIAVSDGSAVANRSFNFTVTGTPLENWRHQYFGDARPSSDAADLDGDGQSNLAEYAAGTDPDNGADRFKVLRLEKTPLGFVAECDGKAGRTYILERRESLGSGIWGSVSSSGPLNGDAPIILIDSTPPATSGFYRIRVHRQ